jgi:hypothetical protein
MIKLFEVISVNIIYFRASLTGTDPIVAFFRGRREYGSSAAPHPHRHTPHLTAACSLLTSGRRPTVMIIIMRACTS